MLIVVEGFDLTGKSTLVDKLVAEEGLIPYHLGPPIGPTFPEHLRWMHLLADLGPERGLVIDRLHWSDRVYGPIWHPNNMLDRRAMDLIDDILFELGAVFIFCDRDPDAVKHQMVNQLDEDHPEVPGIYKHIDQLMEAYRQEAYSATARYPIYHHNFEQSPVNMSRVLSDAATRSIYHRE